MSNITFIMHATPEVHKEFVEKVRNLKYEHEGPLRTGTISPYITEWRTYDVRIPEKRTINGKEESLEAQVLADLGIVPLDKNYYVQPQKGMEEPWQVLPKHRIFSWLIKLFHKITPFKRIEPAPQPINHISLSGFKYCFLIGKLKDPEQPTHFDGKKREVI